MARHVEIDDDSGIYLAWEFPSATGEWEQTDRVSAGEGFCVAVYPCLNEQGRQIILKWFGLLGQADELPLKKIRTMSPEDLTMFRR